MKDRLFLPSAHARASFVLAHSGFIFPCNAAKMRQSAPCTTNKPHHTVKSFPAACALGVLGVFQRADASKFLFYISCATRRRT